MSVFLCVLFCMALRVVTEEKCYASLVTQRSKSRSMLMTADFSCPPVYLFLIQVIFLLGLFQCSLNTPSSQPAIKNVLTISDLNVKRQ